MKSIEYERTFLLKEIPPDLGNYTPTDYFDMYIPKATILNRPMLRIRKRGATYEITKKTRLNNDAAQHAEETIALVQDEFECLALAPGRKLHKHRYRYPVSNRIAEIDIFLDDLSGLALCDFEFDTIEEFKAFKPPAFCLIDVTQEDVILGNSLAGKSYADIASALDRFNYRPLKMI